MFGSICFLLVSSVAGSSPETCTHSSDETSLMQVKQNINQGVQRKEIPNPFMGYNVRRASEGKHRLSLIQTDITVEPPSSQDSMLHKPGLLGEAVSYSQYGQDKLLQPILDQLGSGFFVESGALDGETDSNTLFYEQKSWTGLLVEPSQVNYPILKGKHRHAYSFNGCLSPTGQEESLWFDKEDSNFGGNGGLAHLANYSHIADLANYSHPVKALPLEMLLNKIGRSTVDFWSLDIEGSEAAVLNSTNFANVEVGVMLIEMNKNEANNVGIFDVMKREGFLQVGHTLNPFDKGVVLDRIFINPEYFKKRKLKIPDAADLPDCQLPENPDKPNEESEQPEY